MPATLPPATRRLQAADLPALTHVLARAFADDPIVRWAYPDRARRAVHAPGFFGWSLRRLLQQDVSWTTDLRAGAALWALPGRWRETPRELVGLVGSATPGLGRRAPLVGYGLSTVEALHPTVPHLYLAVLGVEPHHQGSGLGSALLAPGLARCDEDGLPAYLETANERNLGFYGRHGFVVTARGKLPRGPQVWSMWREPR